MFTFLYDKFTMDNMYQSLSQSVRLYTQYIKKHFGVFLSVHSVHATKFITNAPLLPSVTGTRCY